MKKRPKQILLDTVVLAQIEEILTRYDALSQYVERKLLQKELLTTKQVTEKYCITRFTLYRLVKAGMLTSVYKYRTHYFDADDTNTFFLLYR